MHRCFFSHRCTDMVCFRHRCTDVSLATDAQMGFFSHRCTDVSLIFCHRWFLSVHLWLHHYLCICGNYLICASVASSFSGICGNYLICASVASSLSVHLWLHHFLASVALCIFRVRRVFCVIFYITIKDNCAIYGQKDGVGGVHTSVLSFAAIGRQLCVRAGNRSSTVEFCTSGHLT